MKRQGSMPYTKPLTVHLTPKQLNVLMKVATKEQTSMTAVIRSLVESLARPTRAAAGM